MTHLDLDPDLDRLGDALRAAAAIDLAREARAARPSAASARRPRRGIVAGGTLGLAGAGAALVLALGGSSATPAFAVTQEADGAVLVHLSLEQNLPQVNAKLAALGTGEQVTIVEAPGAATASGPVRCTPATAASPAGPTVQILQGSDGTEVIGLGQTGDNTGVGTWHLVSCTTSAAGAAGNSGAVDSDVRHLAVPRMATRVRVASSSSVARHTGKNLRAVRTGSHGG